MSYFCPICLSKLRAYDERFICDGRDAAGEYCDYDTESLDVMPLNKKCMIERQIEDCLTLIDNLDRQITIIESNMETHKAELQAINEKV